MTLPQHSSKDAEWMTPPEVVRCLHRFWGGPPDLDAASDPERNQIIQARQILTKEDDALTTEWPEVSTCFVNPPGGKMGQKSLAGLFWARTVDQYVRRRVREVVFLGFTIELLRTAQTYAPHITPLDCTICVPKQRLRFVRPDPSKPDGLEVGKSPAHANVLVLITPDPNRVPEFATAFRNIGAVMTAG